MSKLRQVFDRFCNANLKLKPKKCELFKAEVTFLGYKVGKDGILPDPNNVSKVLGWKIPENVTEVRQFLGLCSYYRKQIKKLQYDSKTFI